MGDVYKGKYMLESDVFQNERYEANYLKLSAEMQLSDQN